MADKHKKLKLNDVQLRSLAGIWHGDGYQVILDILENECNMAENELIGEHPSIPQNVLALHAIAHAQRAYFQEITGYIDIVMNEYHGTKTDNRRFPTQQEQLLSAIPLTED